MAALILTAMVCVVFLIAFATVIFACAYDEGYERGLRQGYADGKYESGVR